MTPVEQIRGRDFHATGQVDNVVLPASVAGIENGGALHVEEEKAVSEFVPSSFPLFPFSPASSLPSGHSECRREVVYRIKELPSHLRKSPASRPCKVIRTRMNGSRRRIPREIPKAVEIFVDTFVG